MGIKREKNSWIKTLRKKESGRQRQEGETMLGKSQDKYHHKMVRAGKEKEKEMRCVCVGGGGRLKNVNVPQSCLN